MPINFTKALGSHERALMIQSRRAGMLSSNIANADTPGYKARDIDFKAALSQSQGDFLAMQSTSQNHLHAVGVQGGLPVQYRIPGQSSLDGNTVDIDMEKSEFAQNSVRYQTTLRFLTGRFRGMMKALREE